MDGPRFDDLTRRLGRSVSRRTALKTALVAIFAGGVTNAVSANQETCPTRCGERCTDLSSDIWNCGECGHQCAFGGDQPGEICVEGRCICPPEFTGTCGQTYCTNESMDVQNCGACGNQCQSGQLCCSGRCVGRDDSERFCDWCGYLGGWPQDCLPDEVCDRGICVAMASAVQQEPTVELQPISGPAGDLAYAVKNAGRWDIWAYSFDTQQNTQLTSEPYGDRWAPAYSHSGLQLAYLADHVDGTNQIWMMNADGSGKRQITNWYGSESIIGVGWSPDDSQLIVTLFGDRRRMAIMPAGGGELASFVGPSSSFASTSTGGRMVFASDTGDPVSTGIYSGLFTNPQQAMYFALGDTPVVSPDGSYVIVQIGAPGGRYVATYALSTERAALSPAPRIGDDSNPVWLTRDHDYVAFVSAGVNGESIQMARLGETTATPLAIAPHEAVWYLSKQFGG